MTHKVSISGKYVIGEYKDKTVLWMAERFVLCTPEGELEPVDQYEVSAAMYRQLKKDMGWTHEQAAEALGVSKRTAEGMQLGRISNRSREAIARAMMKG